MQPISPSSRPTWSDPFFLLKRFLHFGRNDKIVTLFLICYIKCMPEPEPQPQPQPKPEPSETDPASPVNEKPHGSPMLVADEKNIFSNLNNGEKFLPEYGEKVDNARTFIQGRILASTEKFILENPEDTPNDILSKLSKELGQLFYTDITEDTNTPLTQKIKDEMDIFDDIRKPNELNLFFNNQDPESIKYIDYLADAFFKAGKSSSKEDAQQLFRGYFKAYTYRLIGNMLLTKISESQVRRINFPENFDLLRSITPKPESAV